MEKAKLKVIAVVAVLVLGAGGAALYAVNRDDNNTTATQQTTATQPIAELTVSEGGQEVSYEGQTGKTALEVLKSLAEVETKESSFGEFVVSINGVEADGMTKFWAFYVNGNLANEGAGTYQTKDGEQIEWRVEAVVQ